MADTAAGAQQWMDVMNPNQNVGRVDFAAYGFSTTDDGKVRALGGILDGSTGSDSSIILLTGSFNSGTFNYSGTSFFIPATLASDSSKNFVSRPMMAVTEAVCRRAGIHFENPGWSGTAVAMVSLAGTFIAAAISWKFFESRMIRLGHQSQYTMKKN